MNESGDTLNSLQSTDEMQTLLLEDIKISRESSQSCSRWIDKVAVFSLLANIIAVVALALGYSRLKSHQTSCPDSSGSFPTDFEAVRKYIQLEQRVFSGALDYDKHSGRVYRTANPAGVGCFGEPSPEIDLAWKSLLKGKISIVSGNGAYLAYESFPL